MSAATLLDRLPRLKRLRRNDYVSGCPAHGSRRGRPLHITVLDDGRVLLHPFCGCETDEVLAAVGLDLADLFPERLPGAEPGGGYPPFRSRIPARDLLEVVSEEVTVVAIIATDLLKQKSISEEDWSRLAIAVGRIQGARDHAHG